MVAHNVLHCRQLGVLKNVSQAVMMTRNVLLKLRKSSLERV